MFKVSLYGFFLSGLLTVCISLSAKGSEADSQEKRDIQIVSHEQALQLDLVDQQWQQRFALMIAANQAMTINNQNDIEE